MRQVYVTRALDPRALGTLEAAGRQVKTPENPHIPPARGELLSGIRGVDAVITLLTEQVDAEFLDAAGSRLKIVSNLAVGIDNIDVREVSQRGIWVTNTPGVLDEATADLAFGLMLCLRRRIAEADRFLRAGNSWHWGPDFFVGPDLHGDTLGIVGLGRIGSAVARRAHGFGMRILASGGAVFGDEAQRLGIEAVSPEELLMQSGIVTVHCPLKPETRGLIGEDAFKLMKEDAALINTARGEIVHQTALIAALDSGAIAGAGLDVFEGEPAIDPRLFAMQNVVLSPHIGSAGTTTRRRMTQLAVDNVLRAFNGDEPHSPVSV